jgi:hypothetical protein
VGVLGAGISLVAGLLVFLEHLSEAGDTGMQEA